MTTAHTTLFPIRSIQLTGPGVLPRIMLAGAKMG